jgi:hypothetical protein
VSRLALGPNQPPIQWVAGAFSLGVKCEANHSPPSSAKVKCVELLYLCSASIPSWCGAHLKKASMKYYVSSRIFMIL